MAPAPTGENSLSCKRCKRGGLQSAIKCVKCSSAFPESCARYVKNMKFQNDGTIACCEIVMPLENEKEEIDNDIFWDACDPMYDKAIDGRMYRYIIRQKDELIDELRENIKLLNDHISLNQYTNDKKTQQKASPIPTDNPQVADHNKNEVVQKKSKQTHHGQNPGSEKKPTELHKHSAVIIQPEIKSANSSDIPKVLATSNPTVHKFAGVEKKLWLRIGRSLPNTTPADLLEYMQAKTNDDKFECTQIESKSKHPVFKVGAPLEYKDILYQPDFWPKNIQVSRFRFQNFFRKQSAS